MAPTLRRSINQGRIAKFIRTLRSSLTIWLRKRLSRCLWSSMRILLKDLTSIHLFAQKIYTILWDFYWLFISGLSRPNSCLMKSAVLWATKRKRDKRVHSLQFMRSFWPSWFIRSRTRNRISNSTSGESPTNRLLFISHWINSFRVSLKLSITLIQTHWLTRFSRMKLRITRMS